MGEEGSTTSSFNTRPVHAVRDDLCQLSQASRIFISRNITPEIGACNARRTIRVPSVLSDIEATNLSFQSTTIAYRQYHSPCTLQSWSWIVPCGNRSDWCKTDIV